MGQGEAQFEIGQSVDQVDHLQRQSCLLGTNDTGQQLQSAHELLLPLYAPHSFPQKS